MVFASIFHLLCLARWKLRQFWVIYPRFKEILHIYQVLVRYLRLMLGYGVVCTFVQLYEPIFVKMLIQELMLKRDRTFLRYLKIVFLPLWNFKRVKFIQHQRCINQLAFLNMLPNITLSFILHLLHLFFCYNLLQKLVHLFPMDFVASKNTFLA